MTENIIVVFENNEVHSLADSKKARKFLRDNGLSVNNFFKLGNIWAPTEDQARGTASVLKINPELVKKFQKEAVQPRKKMTTTEKKARRAAKRDAATAEKPIAVHSETYRNCDIVIAKKGSLYVVSYTEPNNPSKTYSGGEYPADIDMAKNSARSLVDIMLQPR